MSNLTSPEAIVVSAESAASVDPYDIIQSNIDFINSLLSKFYEAGEISRDGLLSYRVDYYLSQMENGGFAQFVKNSRWRTDELEMLRDGLIAIGAEKHLALFREGVAIVRRIGLDGLKAFLATSTQTYGKSPALPLLAAQDSKFHTLDRTEELLPLNSAWLKGHPNLVVASAEQIAAEIERRAAIVPDREARAARAAAAAPRYVKLIRRLCENAGHRLQRVTAGDPRRTFDGAPTLAWHFLTDKGHFHMVDAGGAAIMFRGSSTTDRVCQIEAA